MIKVSRSLKEKAIKIFRAREMLKKQMARDPDIREFDMQHEQWLFGGEQYSEPVLKAIDEFMETPV